jgi:allantoicase
MEADVAKAAQLQRETPEYKQAIADIAKAAVDAEVAALRDKTLAPIGVVVDPKAVVKGAVAAVRRGAEAADEVELVSSSASSNAGGL